MRYEDEVTGQLRTVKTNKLADLEYELDSEGPSRFGLTKSQGEKFGCYYGTSDMTMAAIVMRLDVTTRTVQRAMEEVRRKLAQAGISLPAPAERRRR